MIHFLPRKISLLKLRKIWPIDKRSSASSNMRKVYHSASKSVKFPQPPRYTLFMRATAHHPAMHKHKAEFIDAF